MQSRVAFGVAYVVAVLLAAPALAQDAPTPGSSAPPPADGTAPPAGNAVGDLACLSSGMHYQVGEFACIPACHGRRRLARCDVVAEKPSWTYVEETCPSAMINAPWPSTWSMLPAATAMSPIPLVVNLSAVPPDGPQVFASTAAAKLTQ